MGTTVDDVIFTIIPGNLYRMRLCVIVPAARNLRHLIGPQKNLPGQWEKTSKNSETAVAARTGFSRLRLDVATCLYRGIGCRASSASYDALFSRDSPAVDGGRYIFEGKGYYNFFRFYILLIYNVDNDLIVSYLYNPFIYLY